MLYLGSLVLEATMISAMGMVPERIGPNINDNILY